jgi:hypothetical protein
MAYKEPGESFAPELASRGCLSHSVVPGGLCVLLIPIAYAMLLAEIEIRPDNAGRIPIRRIKQVDLLFRHRVVGKHGA